MGLSPPSALGTNFTITKPMVAGQHPRSEDEESQQRQDRFLGHPQQSPRVEPVPSQAGSCGKRASCPQGSFDAERRELLAQHVWPNRYRHGLVKVPLFVLAGHLAWLNLAKIRLSFSNCFALEYLGVSFLT